MGKIVMPKNSALLNEIEAVLQIYYEEKTWLDNETYKDRLRALIGDDQYQSSYTKKAQITSYFGFTVWEDISNERSRRRITDSGCKMYEAIQSNDQDKINDVLMESLEKVKFGRNNYGCPSSDSDVEPPALFIRACIDLDYLTSREFAYLLWKLEDVGANYTDSISEIRNTRAGGNQVNLGEDATKYTDAKPITILERWNFLSSSEESSGGKRIFIDPQVRSKYIGRLRNLKIYNVDFDYLPHTNNDSIESKQTTVDFESRYKTDLKHNLIVFGAPGTGKSHKTNEKLSKLLEVDENIYWERVTFHPDYSYAQFVGTYKPVMVEKQNNDESVDLIIRNLNDKEMTDQQKYEFLVEKFKNMDKMGAIAVLAGVYTDGDIRPMKKDGSYTDNHTYQAEINYGRYLKNYVDLKGCNKEREDIAYEYVPGPFMRVLVEALKDKNTNNPKPHVLIIEEINRANVAAVFGDVFQLLDRDDNNFSKYPIQATEDMKNYLAKKLKCSPKACSTIRIPDNMYIWATMNSADQGVFPMDTAFKRRWDFSYLGIDEGEEKISGKSFSIEGTNYNWNCLRKAINDELSKNNVNEDKLMGPFFLSPKTFEKKNEIIIETICSKMLMYLFEDAAKQKKDKIFYGSAPFKYSSIVSEFKRDGIAVFVQGIRDKYYEYNSIRNKGNEPISASDTAQGSEDADALPGADSITSDL